MLWTPSDPPGWTKLNGLWLPIDSLALPTYGPSPFSACSSTQALFASLAPSVDELLRDLLIVKAQMEIELRLPADFVAGRAALVKSLAEAEVECEERLSAHAKHHRLPVRGFA
jgi:hypothetical protein